MMMHEQTDQLMQADACRSAGSCATSALNGASISSLDSELLLLISP